MDDEARHNGINLLHHFYRGDGVPSCPAMGSFLGGDSRMTTLELRVQGIPKPQGSTRSFYNHSSGKINTISACKDLKDWRGDVRYQARQMMADRGLEITGKAITLKMVFIMPRPKYLQTKKLAPTMPDHLNKPDLDKLERGILDALTSVVYHDDCQVTWTTSGKRYAAMNEAPGVILEIKW